MCVIVDANMLSDFVGPSEDMKLVRDFIENRGKAVYGGKLLKETSRHGKASAYFRELANAGRVMIIPDDEINKQIEHIEKSVEIKSDDIHILGLARACKSRILVSADQNLHSDFCNRDIIAPRGRVYQNRSHAHILRPDGC